MVLIQKNQTFKLSDAEFLISVGEVGEAGKYILGRAGRIDGRFNFSELNSIASAMDSEKRYSAAGLTFSELLNSVLERGYAKAYPHGVRRLKTLDKQSANITDWKSFNSYEYIKDQV